jgi:ribosomal-protein-alanine N-acetyltransferase
MSMTLQLAYPDPPIAGPGFVLRPWAPGDAPNVAAACADPVVQQFISAMPRPYTLEHANSFIASAAESLRDGTAIGMAIAEVEQGRAIGSITLHAGSPWHWHIGYWLAPEWRNRGITTAAVRRFARWAFGAYRELVRLSLFTLPANGASQRVAEHAGFVREGLLRQWNHTAGFPEDVVMFSQIRSDLDEADDD